MEPGQQAGSGKAAAGFRISRPAALLWGEAGSEGGPRFHFRKGLGSQARCLCHFESCDAPSSPEPAAG